MTAEPTCIECERPVSAHHERCDMAKPSREVAGNFWQTKATVLEAALRWAMERMDGEIDCGPDCSPNHGRPNCIGHMALSILKEPKS